MNLELYIKILSILLLILAVLKGEGNVTKVNKKDRYEFLLKYLRYIEKRKKKSDLQTLVQTASDETIRTELHFLADEYDAVRAWTDSEPYVYAYEAPRATDANVDAKTSLSDHLSLLDTVGCWLADNIAHDRGREYVIRLFYGELVPEKLAARFVPRLRVAALIFLLTVFVDVVLSGFGLETMSLHLQRWFLSLSLWLALETPLIAQCDFVLDQIAAAQRARSK